MLSCALTFVPITHIDSNQYCSHRTTSGPHSHCPSTARSGSARCRSSLHQFLCNDPTKSAKKSGKSKLPSARFLMWAAAWRQAHSWGRTVNTFLTGGRDTGYSGTIITGIPEHSVCMMRILLCRLRENVATHLPDCTVSPHSTVQGVVLWQYTIQNWYQSNRTVFE
jgi:hypothetical protein